MHGSKQSQSRGYKGPAAYLSQSAFPHPNLGEAGGQFTHKSRGAAGRNLGSSTAMRISHLPTSGKQWKNCTKVGARREEENPSKRVSGNLSEEGENLERERGFEPPSVARSGPKGLVTRHPSFG